jgi:hypothetical protein
MKRKPQMFLFIVQCMVTIAFFAVAAILIWQVTTPEIQNAPDAHDAIKGLLTAAAVCGALTVGSVIASWGIWIRRPFGRWTAFAMNLIAALILIYSVFDERHPERNDYIRAGIFLFIATIFLLPQSGRVFLASDSPKH